MEKLAYLNKTWGFDKNRLYFEEMDFLPVSLNQFLLVSIDEQSTMCLEFSDPCQSRQGRANKSADLAKRPRHYRDVNMATCTDHLGNIIQC